MATIEQFKEDKRLLHDKIKALINVFVDEYPDFGIYIDASCENRIMELTDGSKVDLGHETRVSIKNTI